MGLAHEGSLGQAQAYIDAAAGAGFDAVKFQTHLAEAESTAAEHFRVKVFPQDASRFDYWKRTAFSREQWKDLAAYAKDRSVLFLSSPFSLEAVELLLECDVKAWKVASGEVTNLPLLRRMVETELPLLISSGMSGWSELDEIVAATAECSGGVAMFQCTSAYPCPPDQWGLNVIGEIIERYSCPVGLSDHSGTIIPSLAAVTLGATLVEVHITFSKHQFGPDAKASLNLDQACELVTGIRQLSQALKCPVDKNLQAEELEPLRRLFMKSVVAARPLEEGHVLSTGDLAFKKPGTGIPAWEIDQLIGRRIRKTVSMDHFFSESDFEQ